MSGRHRKAAARRGSGRHRRPPAPVQWIVPALVTVVVLGAGGLGAYAALSDRGTAPPATTATGPQPSDTLPTDTQSTGAATTPPPTATTPTPTTPTARPTRRPAALSLTVTGRVSWIEVTRPGGHVAFSGLLRHGRRLVYRAGGLGVVIGDAGAVRLVRHGRVTAPAGRPGQVLRFVVH